jgi:hypothetical protein
MLALALAWTQKAAAELTNPAYLQLQVTFSGQLSVKVDGVQYSTYTLLASNGANPGPSAYAVPNTSVTVINDGSITERWQLAAATVTVGGSPWQLNGATGTDHGNITFSGQLACATGGVLGGATCPGADQYAVQALFVSSRTTAGAYGTGTNCPAIDAADWDAVVSTVPVMPGFEPAAGQAAIPATYLANQFADTNSPATATLGGSGEPDSSIPGLSGAGTPGTMLPLDNQIAGAGKRGLCVRVTMPSATASPSQTIQLGINAF